MLSSRLAKVLNLLITTLTTSLYNAREHIVKAGEFKHRTTNIGNSEGKNPNFKQLLAKKENFVSKVNESLPLFGKSRLREARF